MSTPSKRNNAAESSGQAGGVFTITHYIDKNKRNHFDEWFNSLRDSKAKIAIDLRLARLKIGNFGDCKPLRDGVRELRVDVGPGYRAYYAMDGLTVVLLLCGGDKRSQTRDIDRACDFWRDWQERKKLNRKTEGGA